MCVNPRIKRADPEHELGGRLLRWRRPVCASIVLLFLAGCGGGGSEAAAPTTAAAPDVSSTDDPFVLNAFHRGRLALSVSLDGDPLPAARVTIEDPKRPPPAGVTAESTSTGGSYYHGATGKDGTCVCQLRVPTRIEGVDVVINVIGASGPYTHEELRLSWGPTAPSARVSVPFSDFPTDPDEALELHVDLWSR